MISNEHSDKKIMIYNGVTKLMSEGVRIHSIKVSDIAKAAGIGKGTIYDYFTSKEEILEKFLLYNINLEVKNIIEGIKNTEGFKNKCFVIFNAIESGTKQGQSSANLLIENLCPYEFKQLLNKNLEEIQERQKLLFNIIEDIIEEGVNEGIIKEQNDKKYAVMTFLTIFIGFMNLLCLDNNDDIEKSKERSYTLLIKGLN